MIYSLSLYNISTRDVGPVDFLFWRLALKKMKLEGCRKYYPTSPLLLKVADL